MTALDGTALAIERDAILDRLQQLEAEHALGAITEAEYLDLRDEQTMHAANIIRTLAQLDEVKESEVSAASSVSRHHGVKWKKRVAVGAFVVMTVGVLFTATHQRSSNDEITGSTAQNVNTLLRKAQEYTAKQDGVDAVKTYDKVLAKDPNNAQALAYKGWLIRLAGLPNEGLKSINQAIAAQPTYPDAHFFKGFILLRDRDDPKGAIPEFQAFLANNPPQDMVSMVQQALQDAQALAATQ